MTFKEYQDKADMTAAYANVGHNFVYPALGLAGEAGEVANKIKKIERDNANVISEERRDAVKEELGDTLWYIARLAAELGFSIEDVAQANIKKLASRMERNKLHGDGDYR